MKPGVVVAATARESDFPKCQQGRYSTPLVVPPPSLPPPLPLSYAGAMGSTTKCKSCREAPRARNEEGEGKFEAGVGLLVVVVARGQA